MIAPIIILASTAHIGSQHIEVQMDPSNARLTASAEILIQEKSRFKIDLRPTARITNFQINGTAEDWDQTKMIRNYEPGDRIDVSWELRCQEDIQAGELPGEIHNRTVRAHIGEEGVFLSGGSRWHPQIMAEEESPLAHEISVRVGPLSGWFFVASGNPQDNHPIDQPCASWSTPFPVSGITLVGNRHVAQGRIVDTESGLVEVVVQTSERNADKSNYYLDAAEEYLQMYVPLLGAYPYRRFTVVENFFSSGFAFPGFTTLGPRVVGMAPRSLKPGYLDHELVHNWWGNGVFVPRQSGNWCEAITSYCTNYGRRALVPESFDAQQYRRAIINRVSLDPSLDDGPLSKFGNGKTGRFVGYEKGCFVFIMLEDLLADGKAYPDHQSHPIWSVLRHLFAKHQGETMNWSDIQLAFESHLPDKEKGWLDDFFAKWVYGEHQPMTDPKMMIAKGQRLAMQAAEVPGQIQVDPGYRIYRRVPTAYTSPTIAGSLGSGVTVEMDSSLPISQQQSAWLMQTDPGPSLLLIGEKMVQKHQALLEQCADPITIEKDAFTVNGKRWSSPSQSVLHTMRHPERENEYITVFHSNGDIGLNRLALIWYYRKDTTVVWDGDQTVLRRVFEPNLTFAESEDTANAPPQ